MKNNFLHFSILCLFFYQNGIAQVDSLAQLSAKDLKEKSKLHRYSNPGLAKIYAVTLLKRGQNTKNLKEVSDGYHQLGLVDEIEGKYEASIRKYNKAIAIAKNTYDSLLLIDLHLVKGNSYLYLKEYEKVLVNYDTALYISKKLKNISYEILSNACIAYLKKEIGLPEEALEIEKHNLVLSKNIEFTNKTTAINLIANLGETYLALNKNDSAVFYSKQALGKSLLADNIEGTAYIYKTLGLAYYNKKEYERAIRNFKEAESIIIPFEKAPLLSELYFNEARCHYAKKDLKTTITLLKKAEEVNNEASEMQLLEIYKLFAEAYKANGNDDEATDYFQKYVAIDNLRDQSKLKVIGDLHKSSIQNKDDTIAELSSKQQSQQKWYSNLLFISSFIVLLIIGILIKFIITSKKNKRAFQNLLIDIENAKTIKQEPIKSLALNDEKANVILERLKSLEDKKYFLELDFSLASAAKKIKTNPTYLSKTINTHLHKKFQEYVNELRINYAINRLQEDKKFRSYSIEHISRELGYKSPNSFTKHFKKQTGIYPSFFISKIEKLDSANSSI